MPVTILKRKKDLKRCSYDSFLQGEDLLQRTDGMGGFMKGETKASLKSDYS
jgi:hypothetical protein